METTLKPTDYLALERTRLANERTFLAYFRTFVVFASSRIAVLKLSLIEEIRYLGYVLLIISPILLCIGVLRFWYVKRKLKKYFYKTGE